MGLGLGAGVGAGFVVTCIGERSYVKVTAGTPPCCVVCVAAEVVKWYLPIICMHMHMHMSHVCVVSK